MFSFLEITTNQSFKLRATKWLKILTAEFQSEQEWIINEWLFHAWEREWKNFLARMRSVSPILNWTKLDSPFFFFFSLNRLKSSWNINLARSNESAVLWWKRHEWKCKPVVYKSFVHQTRIFAKHAGRKEKISGKKSEPAARMFKARWKRRLNFNKEINTRRTGQTRSRLIFTRPNIRDRRNGNLFFVKNAFAVEY